jgi:23S rRNA (guanosine2251-2'-O)-methyltransferase
MPKVIWGIHPLLEVLKNQPDLIEEILLEKKSLYGKKYQILEKAKALGIPVRIWSKGPFSPAKVPPEANTQGVVAYLQTFEYAEFEDVVSRWKEREEIPLVIALDEVTDPQNVGNILRVADSAGAHGLIIPKHRACEITGTVIKVSSGAAFNLPIVRVTNLKEALSFFKDCGLWVLGLTHRAETTLYDLDLKIPLLLMAGNEERGIRPSILERCDLKARLPMRGKIESLNVAQALSISLYEILRQRYYSPVK